MQRDIDELMVNSYNPEITRAWDGNTDFQICLDFYAIITYITEYYVKDDTGIIKVLVNTLKTTESDDLKEQMKLLMNTWITNRQMGEAEAVYRLTKEFHFRDSDAKCVFLQTCPRSERSKILKNVTGKPGYDNIPKVSVNFHNEGSYIEQYDINSKYERRPTEEIWCLKYLSQAQMVKMYEASWGKKSKKSQEEEDEDQIPGELIEDILQEEEEGQDVPTFSGSMPNLNQSKGYMANQFSGSMPNHHIGYMPNQFISSMPTSNQQEGYMPNQFTGSMPNQHTGYMPNQFIGSMPHQHKEDDNYKEEEEQLTYASSSDEVFQRVMVYGWPLGRGPPLPKLFKLSNTYPGEPPFMKLRTKPAVLRFHKLKVDKDPGAYWFSEAMLYLPHISEENLLQQIEEAKAGGEEAWDQFTKQIAYVKSQVIPYIEDTEEARMMAEMAEQIIDNNMIGEVMDPEGEQEKDDNKTDTIIQQEEFSHLDPEYVDPPNEDIFEKAYRPIEVRPLSDLCSTARTLDSYQKKVLEIGVKHARGLVKARKGKK